MIENAEQILREQRQKAKERQRRFVETQRNKYGRKQRAFLMTDEEFEVVKEIILKRRQERGEDE